MRGFITPKSSHLLDALPVVPHGAMGEIPIPTVKRVQPRMDLGKRLAEFALTVLTVLFVARHMNG
jgi:hypothetical protein